MVKDDFLSETELEVITGTRIAEKQAEYLRNLGLHPYTQPVTGQVVIYRDVVKLHQLGKQKQEHENDGFTMDLAAISG